MLLVAYLVSLSCLTRAHEPNEALIKGVNLYHQGDYGMALKAFNECLNSAEHSTDTQCLILIYRNFGNVYSRLGQPVEALRTYQESVRLAEVSCDIQSEAHGLMNIGALYEEQKDFDKALAIYQEAEALAASIPDLSLLADCANNNAVIYEQQGYYKEALQAYNKALRIYEQLGNDERIGMALNNIGVVYKYLEDFPASVKNYQRSLKLAEKLGDRFLAAANLTNMGNVYFLMGHYAQAIEHHQRSLNIAEEINAVNIIIPVYESLAEVYAEKGDYRRAYNYHQRYVQVNDSFINKERSRQIAELQTKYETEKKEKEIAALKQAGDIQMMQLSTQHLLLQRRNFQILAISAIVLLAGIAAFLFYSRQQLKQKQLREKAVLDAEYRERVRIARDMHDDLGSGLSRISLAAELADRKIGSEQDHAKDIRYIARVSKELVDNMRDLVWILNPEHASLDHLAVRTREFCVDYLEESGIAVSFDMPHTLPDMPIPRELQRNVFLTVKESVHNIVKHAAAQAVHISFYPQQDKLHIKIRDDGQGFDPDIKKTSGNGLRNMQQRIETLKGSYHLSSTLGKGAEVDIVVPLTAVHFRLRTALPA